MRTIGVGVSLVLLISGCAKSDTNSLPTSSTPIDFTPLVTRAAVTSLGEGDSFAVWARESSDGTSQQILTQEEVHCSNGTWSYDNLRYWKLGKTYDFYALYPHDTPNAGLQNSLSGEIPQMVQNIDYAPTFLDLAGAPIPEDIQGVSLLPLLKGEKPADWRKSLYYHFYEYPAEHMVKRHYGVRTDRYKLIHFYNDIDTWELYDLQADPHEMHNLYGQKEYEAVVDELKAEMLKLQEQYDDPVRFSLERDKE